MILAANAAVGVITETNAEKALEVILPLLCLRILIATRKHLERLQSFKFCVLKL